MIWIDANTYFGSWPKRKLDVPAAELVRLLGDAGTSRALTLSLVAPLLEAEEGNEATVEATAENPELIPFGAVDPRKYTRTGAVRRVREMGCAAVRLTNGINGYPLDVSPVEEILRDCAEHDLTVFVDIVQWGDATACERLAETTGTRIVMCGVRYAVLSESVVSMKRSKRLYLEISKLNTPDAIRASCDEVGAGRILFGSGAPFNYAACARVVAEHNNLSDDELDWVSSKTLLSLLRLEDRS